MPSPVDAKAVVEAASAGAANAPVSAEPPKKKQRSAPKKSTVSRLLAKTHANESERLQANQFLLETSARMDGAISELTKCCDVLSDASQENEAHRNEAIKNIRGSILPLLHVGSRSLRDTGMSFAPFGGTKELHHRNEVARKQAALDRSSGPGRATELQLIDGYLERSIVEIPPHIAKLSSSNYGTIRLGMEESDDNETIAIVRPINGKQYTRSEALRCCKLYKKKSKERMLAIRAMISKGWAPVDRRTIQRLCQIDEEGHPIVDEEWTKGGRPRRILHPQEIRERAKKLAQAAGLGKPKASEMVEVTLQKEKRKSHTPVKRKYVKVAEIPMEASESPPEKAPKRDSEEGPSVLPQSASSTASLAQQSASKPPAMQKPGHIKIVPKPRTKTPEEEQQDEENIKNFSLPAPKDGGNRYTKSEAVHICKGYKKGSVERRWAMEAMIMRGYVPNCVRSIQRLLQQDEQGIPVEDTVWVRSGGRRALLTNEEVDAAVARIKEAGGRIDGKEGVKRLIVDTVTERLIKEGKDPEEVDVTVNRTTVRNYDTLFRSKLPSVYWKE
ncbi:hypothetical protein ACHAXT_011068 [Thalassiosira profunda]